MFGLESPLFCWLSDGVSWKPEGRYRGFWFLGVRYPPPAHILS